MELLKETLLDGHVSFSVVIESKVTTEVLAEKLADYFTMVEIKLNRPFGKMTESFMGVADDVTSPGITGIPKAKKDKTAPVIVPRARKYYEKAVSARKQKEISTRKILDYSRVMFGLSMDAEDKAVESFNFSASCIETNRVLEHLKGDEIQVVFRQARGDRFQGKVRV